MLDRHGISRWAPGLTASLLLLGGAAGAQSLADGAQYLLAQAPAPRVQRPAANSDGKEQAPPSRNRRDRDADRDADRPAVGQKVPKLPGNLAPIPRNGVNYWYHRGVWYASEGTGYVVVRPPAGITVPTLPRDHAPVLVGNRIYYYANGIYYRELSSGGYVVVSAPGRVLGAAGDAGDGRERRNVTAKYGQSPERQDIDEEDCDRWALGQSRLDATGALNEKKPEAERQADYLKAQANCLLSRGYEVR